MLCGMTPSTTQEKVRENRLRRMAARQGLSIQKSRVRDPRALDYGKWAVQDTTGKRGLGFELPNIDAVELFLMTGVKTVER